MRLRKFRLLLFTLLPSIIMSSATASPVTGTTSNPAFPLQVSKNRRYLVDAEGRPFFYLADTAWELFHRLDREDADKYLRTRAEQKFTVIQAVVLAEFNGLREPNAYGELPLEDEDPAQPREAYFQHVDWVVNRAAELGLVVGMLPTWGDKWNQRWGQGPEVFSVENAATYGEFLGRRYKDKPIIWILGGDRPIETEEHRKILDAMAAGITKGDGGRHLQTFHPVGGMSSTEWLHDAEWMDFNTLQSGHARNRDNWARISRDYAMTPVKPCLDSEPGYEDHPHEFKKENGYLDEYDVRKAAYWAVFAGALGHTYGCHDIWQMHDPKRFTPKNNPRVVWHEAMHLPGARQMQHLRALMESRPFLTRVPDQALVKSQHADAAHHVQATRDSEGKYALIYTPMGDAVTVDLTVLGGGSGKELRAWWFDPRTGAASDAGVLPAGEATREFTPPASGPGQDWVLVLDDAAQGYTAPGAAR